MTTLEKEANNCKIACQEAVSEEINSEDLCKKICENILQGLLEGYEELKQKNPEKVENFQPKIEELKQQIQENQIKKSLEEIFSK